MTKEIRSTEYTDGTRWDDLSKKDQVIWQTANPDKDHMREWRGLELFEGDWVLTNGCIGEVVYGKFECDTDIDQPNSGWQYTMTFIGWHVRPLKKPEYFSGDTYPLDPDDCKKIQRNFVT